MENYLTLLEQSRIFSGVSKEDIRSMLTCLSAEKKTFPRNSYIFHAGGQTECMYLLLSGSTMIVQEDLWGRRNIMAKLAPGEVFAESFAANPGTVLNISAMTESGCEVLLLNTNRILTLCPTACSHHTRLVRNLVSVLAAKNLMFNDKITHMSRRTTKEKLLSYLSAESIRRNSLSFDIPYDRQQLADYLCVERAAMSAELSKLQKEGFLSYKKNHFTLFAHTLHTE